MQRKSKSNKTGLQPVSRTCGTTPFGFKDMLGSYTSVSVPVTLLLTTTKVNAHNYESKRHDNNKVSKCYF